jgi:hypothetical protein
MGLIAVTSFVFGTMTLRIWKFGSSIEFSRMSRRHLGDIFELLTSPGKTTSTLRNGLYPWRCPMRLSELSHRCCQRPLAGRANKALQPTGSAGG